jgi:YVTN family beta-propeller protein
MIRRARIGSVSRFRVTLPAILVVLCASTVSVAAGEHTHEAFPSAPAVHGLDHSPRDLTGGYNQPLTTPQLNLTPANGTVGETVAASGTGFSPHVQVLFAVGGVPVASWCFTDATGSFPGTTGTACTFTSPPTPAGPVGVVATEGGSATVNVGTTPAGIAWDPSTDQAFVANYGSNDLTVINGTSGAVASTIAVGTNPFGVASDNATREVYVANFYSCCTHGSLSIINDTNDSAGATVPLGDGPLGVAYDPGQGEVFVENAWSGNVSVISDTTHAVVSEVGSGTSKTAIGPGVAYDRAKGEVFVTNTDDGNVTVISDRTNSVVANISVGLSPNGIAYDPSLGELFVANEGSNDVSVINDTYDTVVATVPVGLEPVGVADYSNASEILITNYGSNNVSVISAPTNVVVGNMSTGAGPVGIAYDSRVETAFVTNSEDGTVSALVTGILSSVNASATFVIGPRVTLQSPRGPPYGSVVVTGEGFAANATISFSFGGLAAASNCSTDGRGSFPGTTGTPCTFTAPSGAAGTHSITANDSKNEATVGYTITQLLVSPTNGPVGSTVTASGSGFPTNSAIDFTVGGVGVESVCRTDASGSFPGSTGEPCGFVVPNLPGGPETVTAGISPTDFTATTLNVGAYPEALAVDPSTNQVFVVNSNSNNVSVFDASNDSLVATIAVGFYPVAIADDPPTSRVFVADYGSYIVSVIDASNDSLVATITVGGLPIAIADDPSTGQVFVAASSGSLSVIAVSSDSVVATVSVGSYLLALADDPSTKQLFVANYFSNDVEVIAASSDTLAATVNVGSYPIALADDPATGQVFVANSGSNSLSILRASNDSLVATLNVGSYPIAVADDPATEQVFVTNFNSNNTSVIAASNDSLIATVAVGTAPYAMADGPFTDQMFVANSGSNNVSIIATLNDSIVATVNVGASPLALIDDPEAGQVFVANAGSNDVTIIGASATALRGEGIGAGSLTVDASLAVRIASGTGSLDVGQTATVVGSGYGRLVSATAFTIGSSPLNCTVAVIGSCTSGTIGTDSQGSFSANFTAPSVPTNGSYTVSVTDSVGNTANTTVIVDTDPTVGLITASRLSIDLGQNVTFSVGASSAGSGGYRYRWEGVPSGCLGVSMVFACTPRASGNFSIMVTVTDSNGYSVTGGSLNFTVFSDPTAMPPIATPGSGQVDAGQTVVFTTAAGQGTGEYISYHWTGLPSGCTGTATATVTCSEGIVAEGTYTIWATVTDSNGETSSPSSSLAFVVVPDPTVTVPVSNRTSADAGQSVAISDSSAAAPQVQSFSWVGLPTSCLGVDSSAVICTFNSPGTFSVTLQVTDHNNFTVRSAALSIEVYADPSVSVNSTLTALDIGTSMTLAAAVVDGSPGDSFTWSNLPTGCQGNRATISCSPSAAGRFSVGVTVIDSNGASAKSTPLGVTVGTRVAAAIASDLSAAMVGEGVTFNATGSGGIGALSYQWAFGDGTVGSGASTTHSYLAPGNYTVAVWVNDTVGGSAHETLLLTIGPSSSGSGSKGAGGNIDVSIAAAVAGAAVVVAAALLLIRRRRARQYSAGVPSEEYSRRSGLQEEATDPESRDPE